MTPETVKRNVQFVARQLGFDDCRVSAAQRAPHADNYLDWVEQGHAARSHDKGGGESREETARHECGLQHPS